MLSILRRQPLSYRVVRQNGSHRALEADGYPDLNFAFHDKDTLPPGMVRTILVKRVGLSEEQARKLV